MMPSRKMLSSLEKKQSTRSCLHFRILFTCFHTCFALFHTFPTLVLTFHSFLEPSSTFLNLFLNLPQLSGTFFDFLQPSENGPRGTRGRSRGEPGNPGKHYETVDPTCPTRPFVRKNLFQELVSSFRQLPSALQGSPGPLTSVSPDPS